MNLTCGGVEGHAHSSAQAKACKLLQPEKVSRNDCRWLDGRGYGVAPVLQPTTMNLIRKPVSSPAHTSQMKDEAT